MVLSMLCVRQECKAARLAAREDPRAKGHRRNLPQRPAECMVLWTLRADAESQGTCRHI